MVYPAQPNEVGRITLVLAVQPDMSLGLQIDVDLASTDPAGDCVQWLRKAAAIISGEDEVKVTIIETD